MNVGRKDNEEAEFPGRCGGAVAGNDDRQGHRHVLQNPAQPPHRRGKLRLFHHGLRYLHRAAHDLHDGPARRHEPHDLRGPRAEQRQTGASDLPRLPHGLPVHRYHRLGADADHPEAAGQHDGEPECHVVHLCARPGRALRVLHLRLPRLLPGAGEHGSYGRQPDHRGPVQALPRPRPCLGSS